MITVTRIAQDSASWYNLKNKFGLSETNTSTPLETARLNLKDCMRIIAPKADADKLTSGNSFFKVFKNMLKRYVFV